MNHLHALAVASEKEMRPTFIDWLWHNRPVWDEFCALALLVQERGRKTWSARAIIHVLRWNRIVRDATDPLFKINNNWTPEMARLYNTIYGASFFNLRN